MTPIETIEHEGLRIKVYPDEDPIDPRKEYDNLGKMICFHKRYRLGDEHEYDPDDYRNWDEMEKALVEGEDAALILPVYLYDHSGLRMKIGSFQGLLPQGHAEFDSGQVGFILVSKAKVREEYSVKRVSKQVLAKAYEALKSEVNVYDEYLSGQVYGYVIEEDADGNELPPDLHDSRCGFFGFNYCVEQAKDAAKGIAPKAKARLEDAATYGDCRNQLALPFDNC
jgi:hypothetical protein